ncbi:MAG: ABC-type multidrug transport system, ATPase component [Bacilli bacterium]|nr:ABC-type multidrug transport system, ATPase component [Bacilli bacterium]
MEKVLEIHQITKIYKNQRGIKDVSFNVYRGDVFGFFGPNGAGKSTLLKIITGLMRTNKGTVKIFGLNPMEHYEKAMKKVGCIIESADSYEYMTAFQNLKMTASYYPNVSNAELDKMLETVGLIKYRNEKASNFSTGMKMRLAIAAVLIADPDLVILDEPTNGLDIEGLVDFRQLIKRLSEEQGVTFLISSHMINEMEQMCNRIGILYEGKLLTEGLVADLLTEHESLEQYFINQLKLAREEKIHA